MQYICQVSVSMCVAVLWSRGVGYAELAGSISTRSVLLSAWLPVGLEEWGVPGWQALPLSSKC